jgi:transcriptional regulator with XRE-family HTH domain
MSPVRTATIKETPKEFFSWLDKRLDQLVISERELCRRAGLSHSVISKARSGIQPIGYEACIAIAGPLNEQPETVLRLAGHLPKQPDWNPKLDRLLGLFNRLSDDEQEEELETLQVRVERRKRGRNAKRSETRT